MSKTDTFELLKKLTAPMGVSGAEGSAAQAAASELDKFGSTEYDAATGNLFFRRKGWQEGRPVVMLDAHIDEIGFIVNYITDDGFLKVSSCGGIDRRMLLAQRVRIYGTKGEGRVLDGFTASVPPHLAKDYSKAAQVEEVLIDTGMSGDEVREYVSLGDRVLVENECSRLLGSRVTSKALDDRAGCAALIMAVAELDGEELGCNVAVTLTSQEEVGERGAKTAAFIVEPDAAIEVDVSFANTPDSDDEECVKMGSGVMIGISPSLSRKLSNDMRTLAQELSIPYTMEVMGRTTGTNADMISISKSGCPTVTLSIPERFMHTPVEVIDTDDIENTAKLIAEYLRRYTS